MFDQVDGLGQALVGVAQHRFHDDLAMPLELPAEQLEGCVIPLGHPFSPGAMDRGYKSIPSQSADFDESLSPMNISLDNEDAIAL